MKFFSWLRRQTSNNVGRSRTRRLASARLRPQLEALEDRMLLSTFLVTNTGDNGGVNPAAGAGTGTLRQAIVDADAHTGANTIAFDIADSGVQTIALLSALPALTAAGTTLNGYSQPGAKVNTLAQGDNAVLLIALNGNSAGASADGLNVTGGHCTVSGLVIESFGNQGIFLSGAGKDVVQGNFIGTDPTGDVAEGNGQSGQGGHFGIQVNSNAPSCLIGGTNPAERNLISGNLGGAIDLVGVGGTQDKVEGNYLGTDATGVAALGNTGVGVVAGGSGNVIGGTVAGAGNVIAANGSVGVYLSQSGATGNTVAGNLIGLGADGQTPLGNSSYGICIVAAPKNTIGGTTAAARNIISENEVGIYLSSGIDNVIEGNYIGTDSTGQLARGNNLTGGGESGIITQDANTTIKNNLISGNAGIGLLLAGTGAVVQGNKIGTDATGTVALGNDGAGIYVIDGKSTIGGSTTATRNIISANGEYGIDFATTAAVDNLVEGNYIGTDATGASALGNTWAGVVVFGGASGTIIGGTKLGTGNVISGNLQDGVLIEDTSNGNATGNVVEGNYIGLAAGGTQSLFNGGNGVTINASGNMVGGQAKGAGNFIQNNHGAGVDVAGGTGDSIFGNSIYLNGGGGIVLAPGANHNQPAPQITFAKAETADTVIEGALLAAPNTTYTIEFFASATADPSGFGQGETFLKRITVTTDAFGLATFIVDLPLVPVGQFITATATDSSGDTSAFSNAFAVS